ncbi:MAG: FtsX-like permease family protein [Bacteroidales bacterium]|nr:FtsX-like permease family protein [Bacteroidales bacterium]
MKSYLRFLSRNKLYTAIEVVGLSVALAFVLLIGSYVWQEYSISHENPDYERVFILTQYMPYGALDPLKEQIPEMEKITLVNDIEEVVMEYEDERLVTRGLAVRGDFFDIFDYEFVIGDAGCMKSHTDIIVSESYAVKLAGKPELAVGMKIIPTEYPSQALTVTGVIKDFDHKYWKYMDFICSGDGPLNDSAQKNPVFTLSATTFIKAAESTDEAVLLEKIQTVFKQFWGERMPADRTAMFADMIGIERFDRFYFSSEEINDFLNMGDRRQIIILLIVSLLLLVSAVINYINLNLALTNKRAKEMATRSLVGAEKAHIAVKYILESIGFTAVCSIAAVGIAVALAPYIGRIIDGQTVAIPFNAASISIYVLFVVLLGSICGLIPALNISSIKPISIVNGTYRRKSRAGLNRVFILLQNIVAITLIASAIILDRQMNHMINMPLGADIEDKFILSTDVVETGDIIPVMDEIRQLPFVKKVALSRGYPTNMNFFTAIQLENSTDLTSVALLICDTEAFGMWDFDIKVDSGAPLAHSVWFTESLYNCFDSREAAEKIAKSWDGNFNRSRIDNFGGVLGNIASDNAMNETMEQSMVAVIVLPVDDFGLYNNTILIETDENHDEAFETFDRIYRKFSDEYNGAYIEPWDFGYVEDMMVRVLEENNRTVKLLKISAILAVILSILGLVAMSTYFASEREKGIAIRKVFGGTMTSETRRNISEYMIITIIGSAVAIPVAWIFCGRYLEEFAYRIDLTIWPFAAAVLLALAISLASVLWQTLRAARTNPAEALKKE